MPRTLRARLTLVIGVGGVVLVALLIAAFNVVLRDQIRGDLDTRLKERTSAALANVDTRKGRLVIHDAPGDEAIDQLVWVFAGDRLVARPSRDPAGTNAARLAAARPGTFAQSDLFDLRLHSQAITAHGRKVGAIVTGESLQPYETTSKRALVASIVLGVLVIAGILVAARLAISAALRPVDRMTAEAAAWSLDELDHRFTDVDTGDELGRLAATFNDLLARLSAALRHEQRFSAELSHELRTPLAKLIIESELALRRERVPDEYRAALTGISEDARQMQGVIETMLAVARSELDPRKGTADAHVIAETVVASLRGPGTVPVDIEMRSPGPLRVGVDAEVAERVLAPVIANALQFASHGARVELDRHDSTVRFAVYDDGPGVPVSEREAIFQPGYRGTNGRNGAGTGLGLALARRLARAADGSIEYADSAFVISLPTA